MFFPGYLVGTGVPRSQGAGILRSVGGTFLIFNNLVENGGWYVVKVQDVHEKRWVLKFAWLNF